MRGEGPPLGLSTSWNRARLGGLVPALREIGELGLGACEVDTPHATLEVRAAAGFAARNRMRVAAVRWPEAADVPFHDLADPDDRRRAAAERLASAVVAAAAALRSPVVVIPAVDAMGEASRWPDVGRTLDGEARARAVAADLADREGRVEALVDRLCRAAHAVHSREPGLQLAFAPAAAPGAVPAPREIDWLLDDRPSAAVFAWHDVGVTAVREHLGVEAPGAWLERARRSLAGAYLCDASGVASDLPPGAGVVDWDGVREGLPADVPWLLKVAPSYARLAVQEGIEFARRL